MKKGGFLEPPSFAFRQTLKEKSWLLAQPGFAFFYEYLCRVSKLDQRSIYGSFEKILVIELPGLFFYVQYKILVRYLDRFRCLAIGKNPGCWPNQDLFLYAYLYRVLKLDQRSIYGLLKNPAALATGIDYPLMSSYICEPSPKTVMINLKNTSKI